MISAILWLVHGIISLIGGTGKQIGIEVAKFTAMKALLLFLVFVAAPIVIYNVFGDLMMAFAMYGIGKLAGIDIPSVNALIQLTGMGGWVAEKIQIPEAMSIFMAFVSIRFDINLVKAVWLR
jgi:hypothetical protein